VIVANERAVEVDQDEPGWRRVRREGYLGLGIRHD